MAEIDCVPDIQCIKHLTGVYRRRQTRAAYMREYRARQTDDVARRRREENALSQRMHRERLRAATGRQSENGEQQQLQKLESTKRRQKGVEKNLKVPQEMSSFLTARATSMNKNIKKPYVLCTVVYPKKSCIINSENSDKKLNNEISSSEFKCNVCTKTFDRKSSLVLHERTHLDDRPLTCKVCQKTFLDKSLLNKHLITQGHGKSTESDKGLYTDKYNSLTRHRPSDKSFKCHICFETYKDEWTLKNHLYLHVDNNRKSSVQDNCKGQVTECKTLDTITPSTHAHQDTFNVSQAEISAEIQLNSDKESIENNICQESSKTEIPVSEHSFFLEDDISNCTLSHKLPLLKDGSKSFLCEICQGVSKRDSLMAEHVCSRVQLFDWQVAVSKEKLLQQNSVKKPIDISTNEKKFNRTKRNSFVCCKCQEVFENKTSLSLHFCTLKNKALIKTYNRTSEALKCHASKKAVDYKSSITVSQPADIKQFICDICKQHFLNKEALTFHLQCHIESKFVCEDCQSTFDTRKLLEIHRRSIGRKQFLCHLCQKVFCCEKSLINHYEIHNRKEKFSCDVCDKIFKNKFILNVHYFVHTKNVPFFICPICLKIFSNRNNWVSHCCTHMGTKPRICEICKKYFVKRRNFYLHCRIHTDEEPYICETCHKTFKYHNTLVMHRHVHAKGNL